MGVRPPAREEQKWNMVFSLDPDEEDAQQEKAVAEYNEILKTKSEEQLIHRLSTFLEHLWNSQKEIHYEIDRLDAEDARFGPRPIAGWPA